MIKVGEKAPEFSLPSNLEQDGKPGKKVSLADYKGKNVVLAFYPLDFSPVCTQENSCFVNDWARFEGANAVVLGISVDSAWAHKAFAEKLKIAYPLLADFNPKGGVAKAYGVYREQDGTTERALFVIDRDKMIAWSEVSPVGINPGADGALQAVEALS